MMSHRHYRAANAATLAGPLPGENTSIVNLAAAPSTQVATAVAAPTLRRRRRGQSRPARYAARCARRGRFVLLDRPELVGRGRFFPGEDNHELVTRLDLDPLAGGCRSRRSRAR